LREERFEQNDHIWSFTPTIGSPRGESPARRVGREGGVSHGCTGFFTSRFSRKILTIQHRFAVNSEGISRIYQRSRCLASWHNECLEVGVEKLVADQTWRISTVGS
jgi:hypothetical protein